MAAGQSWSVIINGEPATFVADVYGTPAGEPLKAQIGDIVCWNNQTVQEHQLAVADGNGNISFETDVIRPWTSSSPGYVTQKTDAGAGTTIRYSCLIHAGEEGQITVVTS